MSVEYYIFCETHNQSVSICSDGLSGPLLQCDRSLAAFVITHRNCKLTILDEHNEEHEDRLEWDKTNWKQLINYEL
jgi:hypothetical protein